MNIKAEHPTVSDKNIWMVGTVPPLDQHLGNHFVRVEGLNILGVRPLEPVNVIAYPAWVHFPQEPESATLRTFVGAPMYPP